jgi:flagellar motor switch/type III secretory pathway protein FliN
MEPNEPLMKRKQKKQKWKTKTKKLSDLSKKLFLESRRCEGLQNSLGSLKTCDVTVGVDFGPQSIPVKNLKRLAGSNYTSTHIDPLAC